MSAVNSAFRFLPYTSNNTSSFTRGMLFVLGFQTRGQPAGDGEIKPGDLSTDLEHIYYDEGEFELLERRNIFFFVNQNLLKLF